MNLRDLGEFGLIERITKLLKVDDPQVIVSFGDDCSVIKTDKNFLLFSSDIQIENHHFIKDKISPEDLGWKLVSVNVSDIISCGGKAKWGFISVAFPPETSVEYVERLYKGIQEACNYYNCSVIGGNTSASEEIILDLFIVGQTDRPVLRKGAQEGDILLVSGYTGLSRAGLELLLMDKNFYEDFEERLITTHTKPVVPVELSEKIMRYTTSCIDISDGLVADLGHLQKASGVKVIIEKDKLPVHPDLERFCHKYNKNPYDYILYGGEDYQLLFTTKSENLSQFKSCFQIGYVEQGEGLFLEENSNLELLKPRGFQHL